MSAWMENGWTVYLPGHRHRKRTSELMPCSHNGNSPHRLRTELSWFSLTNERLCKVVPLQIDRWDFRSFAISGKTSVYRSLGSTHTLHFYANSKTPRAMQFLLHELQNGCCVWWKRNEKTFEFSHNTQNWQCWHFCTTSNENKLEVVTSEIMLM